MHASTALLAGCASGIAPNAPAPFDAVVDASALDGQATRGVRLFKKLGDAINAKSTHRPPNDPAPWRIFIRDGVYREKLEIAVAGIQLIGESRANTVLTFDAFAGQFRPGTDQRWTTFGCASITVRAPDFTARNLSIRNDYNYLANDGLNANDPRYTNDPQGVALMLAQGSDRADFRDVDIFGHQDTLFVDAGRSRFSKCRISGGVDFIFGAGQTVFLECDIVSRERTKPNVFPLGYVTAPSTSIHKPHGFVFWRCHLTPESARVGANTVALGRPWHPAVNRPDGRYADPDAIGSSVFIECEMDHHILHDGWWSMTGLQKSGPDRTVFPPESARFFEYATRGAGAQVNAKRRQLPADELANFAPQKVFGDWGPK